MAHRIITYEFEDAAFVTGIDPVVCVVRLSELKTFMSLREILGAFSGYVSYRQAPFGKHFVGVWGRKNCQRLRRFVRKRGAEVELVNKRPSRLRLSGYKTLGARTKVRALGQLNRTLNDIKP